MKRGWLAALPLPFALLILAVAAAQASVSISDMGDQDQTNKIVKKVKPVAHATPTPGQADTLRQAIEKDRAETQSWLQSAPTSYLAAIARRDFGQKTVLNVGKDISNDVRLADTTVMARHLRVQVFGDSFRVEGLDAGAKFIAHGDTVRTATLGPGTIQVGRFTLRLSHQHYPAIIVFDPQSPRLKEYKGLSYFPIDFSYRFVLPLTPNPEADTVEILSTHSQPRQAVRAGWFVFDVGGKKCVLEANRLLEPGVGERDVSVFFRDETTGKESYDVGRYVDPERLPDGRYVLDFNSAYNPACATSPHYNCPIPPKFNKLKVAIKAGEKNSHYVH